MIVEQYEAMLALYGAEIGVNCARKHIGWYTKGLHGSAEFRNAFNQEADPDARQGDAARFLRALAEPRGRLSDRARRCGGRAHSLCSLGHIVVLEPQCERRSRDPCRVLPAALAAAASRHARGGAASMPLVEIGWSSLLVATRRRHYFLVTRPARRHRR